MANWFQNAVTAVAKTIGVDRLARHFAGFDAVFDSSCAGTRELLDAYRTSPWLRTTISHIGDGVAGVPWKVFAVTGKDGKAMRVSGFANASFATRTRLLANYRAQGRLKEVDIHPLLTMMENANAFDTGFDAIKLSQSYLDVKGETFWLLERNSYGMPVSFWVLPPHWVLDTPHAGRPTFRVQFPTWVGEIPEYDMIWFKDRNLLDPYGRGIGVAESLGDEIDTDQFAAAHTKTWFYNSAIPPLLVSIEGIKQPELEKVKAEWEQKNRGLFNSGQTHFVNRPMKAERLDSTFQDQQMVPMRKFERDTIIQVFGVPPEIIGILENSNRSTISAADFLFCKYVLVPRLEFLRRVMQQQLVGEYDDRLILDYVDPTPGDNEFALQVVKAQPWIYTLDEYLELVGKQPIGGKDGKVRMRPVNYVPYTLGETVVNPNTPAPAPEPPKPTHQEPSTEKALSMDEVVAALDIALGNTSDVTKGFNATTKAALIATLEMGVASEESTPQLVKRITAVFAEAKGKRAEEAAHTGDGSDGRKVLGAMKRALQRQESEIIKALNALNEG